MVLQQRHIVIFACIGDGRHMASGEGRNEGIVTMAVTYEWRNTKEGYVTTDYGVMPCEYVLNLYGTAYNVRVAWKDATPALKYAFTADNRYDVFPSWIFLEIERDKFKCTPVNIGYA
jgi:hypothetical protein